MIDNSKIVFVLGAGFTKEFDSKAPLLRISGADLEFPNLLDKYKNFPKIKKILEGSVNSEGEVDIESFLTRLSSGIPFDFEVLPDAERKVLLDDVKENFLKLIKSIKINEDRKILLQNFSKYSIENSATFITFNYDTLLDEYLWNNNPIVPRRPKGTKYFQPDGGYGFFFRSAKSVICDTLTEIDRCTTFILKLHGSINWRIKTGSSLPFTIDSLVHDEEWYNIENTLELTEEDKSIHL